jgi:hypothetical protein
MSGFFVCVFTEPGNGTTHFHYVFKNVVPPPLLTPYVSWRNIRFCHTTNEWKYRTTYTMSPLVFSLLKNGVVVVPVQSQSLCRGFFKQPRRES